MMVMTAKVNFKKLAIILAAAVGIILALVLLFSGGGKATETAATVSDNDSRVQFLKSFGWDVTTSPVESNQVRIPNEMTPVFERYNALQQSQGYDLTKYAGKTVMRYVYRINNYPNATEPVYATLLIYKNHVIGGDITNTAANGAIQGFKMQQSTTEPTVTEPTATQAPTATQ